MSGVLADNRTVVGGDGRQLIYVPMGQGGTGTGGSGNTSSTGNTANSGPAVLPPEILAPATGNEGNPPRPPRNTPRPARGEGGSR